MLRVRLKSVILVVDLNIWTIEIFFINIAFRKVEQAIQDKVKLIAEDHHAYFDEEEQRESNQIEYISYFVSSCVDAVWTVSVMKQAHQRVNKNKEEDCEGQHMEWLWQTLVYFSRVRLGYVFRQVVILLLLPVK